MAIPEYVALFWDSCVPELCAADSYTVPEVIQLLGGLHGGQGVVMSVLHAEALHPW